MNLVQPLNSMLSLLYPRLCIACREALYKNEKLLCTKCYLELPRVRDHCDQENYVSQLFWGRVYIENVTALYYFNKNSKFQKMIHKLKYNGQKEIGIGLGKMLGSELKESAFSEADYIIPVPLHPKKERKRGYNQSEIIAEGISAAMKKPVENNTLVRIKETSTQTKKGRTERWESVSDVFSIKEKGKLQDKHIILVDDIITTGATIEACVATLHQIEGIKISVVSLGVTGT